MKASFLNLHRLILFKFIKVKAHHFQTFSKSHSVTCFSIGQITQTFCVFCTCKRYACCLFRDLKKLHPCKHKTTCETRKYCCDRKEKLRKTGNEWKKLVTTSKKRVGNITLVHFFLNQQHCFEKLMQWNYLHLWTNQISVEHSNINWDVCKPCTTDVLGLPVLPLFVDK